MPLGYARHGKTLAPSPDADAVRLAYDRYESGNEFDASVADALNAAGWRALDWKSGERRLFGRESVRVILTNPAYKGVVRCSGEEYPGRHEPLVSPAQWERVQKLRAIRAEKGGRARTPTRGPGRGGALTGIARCAVCGERMWWHRSGRKAQTTLHYYVCAGRGHRTCTAPFVRAGKVEEDALAVLAALTIPRALHPLILQYVGELQQATTAPRPVITPEQIQAQIRRLGLVWAAGDLDDATYQRERARLQQLLAEVRQQPTDTPLPPVALSGALERLTTFADAARAATIPEQRTLFRDLFEHVWIGDHTVKATTPSPRYRVILGAVQRLRAADVSMGWLTGFNPAKLTFPVPAWRGFGEQWLQ